MPLVPAICTQCGASIEVDETKEAGICKYCGTAFVTEKAITNYNIKASSVNVNGNNINIIQTDVNEQIAAANKLAKEGLIKDASDLFRELTEKYPHEYKVWWGYSLFEYKYKMEWFEEQFSDAYKKARALSDEEGLKAINNYVLSEKKRIFDEGKNIIDFCKNPDYSMLDNIYVKFSDGIGINAVKLKYENNKLGLYACTYESNFLQTKYWYRDIFYTYVTDIKYDLYDNAMVGILTFAGGNQLGDVNYTNLKEIRIYIRNINEGKITIEDEITDLNYISRLNKTKQNGCYIATCVYGSYDCPQVWTLRRFRDYMLDVTWYGRLFIKCYYAISPTLVKWFGETKWFRSFWKSKLDKMVADLNRKGVKDTHYHDKY